MDSYLAKRIILSLIMASGLMVGQTKPNLNGVWKMDPAKSDYSSGPVAESRQDRIALEGVNLKDTITTKLRHQDETTYDMIYTIDGRECTNHAGGRLVKSKARWDGDVLVIDSKVFAPLRNTEIEDRWALSGDGQTITLHRHMTGMVNADQTVVFERQ